jgi:hypothetical protein
MQNGKLAESTFTEMETTAVVLPAPGKHSSLSCLAMTEEEKKIYETVTWSSTLTGATASA